MEHICYFEINIPTRHVSHLRSHTVPCPGIIRLSAAVLPWGRSVGILGTQSWRLKLSKWVQLVLITQNPLVFTFTSNFPLSRLQLKGSQGQFWLSYIIHLLPPCHACSKPCFSSPRGWPRAPGWPSSLLPEDQRAASSARDKKNPGEDILPCFPACWSGGQGKTCSYFSTLPFTLTTTIWRVLRFNVFSADSDKFLKLSTTLYYLLMTPDSEVFLHVLPHFPVFELPSHVRAKQL